MDDRLYETLSKYRQASSFCEAFYIWDDVMRAAVKCLCEELIPRRVMGRLYVLVYIIFYNAVRL